MSPKTKMSDDEILKRLHLMVDGLRTPLEWSRDEDGRLGMYPSVRITFATSEGESVVLVVGLEEPEPDDDPPEDDDED